MRRKDIHLSSMDFFFFFFALPLKTRFVRGLAGNGTVGIESCQQPGFMLRLAHKDCRIALEMIEGMGLDAPVGRAALAACQEGLDMGLGAKDVGVLLKIREDDAGVKVRLPS